MDVCLFIHLLFFWFGMSGVLGRGVLVGGLRKLVDREFEKEIRIGKDFLMGLDGEGISLEYSGNNSTFTVDGMYLSVATRI